MKGLWALVAGERDRGQGWRVRVVAVRPAWEELRRDEVGGLLCSDIELVTNHGQRMFAGRTHPRRSRRLFSTTHSLTASISSTW